MVKKINEPTTPPPYNPLTAPYEFRREVADGKTHGLRSVSEAPTSSRYGPDYDTHRKN